MTAANGATYAFSRRPLSRPYRPFIGRILKGTFGSNLNIRHAAGQWPLFAHSCHCVTPALFEGARLSIATPLLGNSTMESFYRSAKRPAYALQWPSDRPPRLCG